MTDISSDDDKELEQRMRANLGVEELPKAEAEALAKAKSAPLPKKVLVRKERIWGLHGMHFRWFFIGVDEAGVRRAAFSTTHEGIAKSEAERYQKLGVPMEVLKEIEFE